MEEEVEKGRRFDKQFFAKAFRLFRFIAPYKFLFFVGLACLLASSLTTLAFPLLLGKLFDSKGGGNINLLALALLGIFLINAFFSYFRIVLFENVAQKSLDLLRRSTYDHLIRLPMSFFSSRRVGELNSRISSDISLLQTTFTTTSAEFLRQILTILGGIALLITISFKLTLFMLGIVPIISVVAIIFGKFIRKLSKQTQDAVADSNTIVEETLQGISSVKSYANEPYESMRYAATTSRIVSLAINTAKYRGAFVSFIIFGLFGSIIGVIWYGLLLRESGDISDGDLFSFVLYTVFVGASIGGIADLYSQLVKAIGASENLLEILDESAESGDTEVDSGTLKLKGSIQFRHVGFSYPSRSDVPVLSDITFEVNPGQTVALVGASGAGKSTIAFLLLRFYDPKTGSILFDGVDGRDVSVRALRNEMAMVPQEVLLFGGTIRENILYGRPNASDEEVIIAAKKANAWSFIESFPEKLETVVGDRGIQLSGGQRQRVAIARAVLKNPEILILDEATSALDTESEQLVQDALGNLMKGRTSVVIAHRLSTIRNADKIIVLEHGKIAETGTHEELIVKESGVYANLNRVQFEIT